MVEAQDPSQDAWLGLHAGAPVRKADVFRVRLDDGSWIEL
jgi:hypothetical protein